MSDEISFEAAYSNAVEHGWDSVKDLARQIWDQAQAQAAPEAEPVEVVATLLIADPCDRKTDTMVVRAKHAPGQIVGGRVAYPLMTVAQHQRIFAAQRIKTCIALKERNDAMALKAAPQHDADHIPDTTKMVDAELVELLRACVNEFRGITMSRDLPQRIDAKLATLSAKNEGGKA